MKTVKSEYNAHLLAEIAYYSIHDPHPTLHLQEFTYPELFSAQGLTRLDQTFLTALNEENPKLHAQLLQYRSDNNDLTAIEISELLISCATILEQFLADLFHIDEALAISQAQTTSQNPISVFKKYFVMRRAKKEVSKVDGFPSLDELNKWLEDECKKAAVKAEDKELTIALLASQYLRDPEKQADNIEKLVQWCTRVLSTQNTEQANWVSFHLPERIDYANLVPTVPVQHDKCGRLAVPESKWRKRDGFKLTDPRMSAREVQDEVNYCIYCHDHEGDLCSKGFPVKKGDPSQGLKKNPLDITLTGCPLEEKISEMQLLKKDGRTLASLAMVMVDNPMCPATGHRICNDCMKACIYQKQDPVNIPQIETRVLTDVLDLPWAWKFMIYSHAGTPCATNNGS